MSWRRILAAAVVCVLVIAIPTISQAAVRDDAEISPLYNYTRRIEAGLDFDSAGNATCYGAIAVYDSTSTISMKVSLYQKVGSSWDRVTSWYDSSTGSTRFEVEGTYKVSEYGRYKTLVTGTVTSADGDSEWFSLESDQVTYP